MTLKMLLLKMHVIDNKLVFIHIGLNENVVIPRLLEAGLFHSNSTVHVMNTVLLEVIE